MATASKLFKDVKIKLEMTALEAAVLHAILQKVGGMPDTTLRGVADDVGAALAQVLMYDVWNTTTKNRTNISGVNTESVYYPIKESIDPREGIQFKACIKTRADLERDIQFHLANS